jgi:hypothetical protein
VEQDQREFTEFYTAAWDDCLRIVMVSAGNRQLAEDLVAEAFTKAWMSWRKVNRLSGEMPRNIPASEIITRARRRRRLRRGLSAVAAACAAAGLAVGLMLPSGSQARLVHVHLAAWSVDTNSNGTGTVTVHDLTHVALLLRLLRQAGVPAVVTIHVDCLQNQNALTRSGALRSGRAGVVITPAAIPSGTAILFGLVPAYAERTWSPSTGWVQGHGTRIMGFGWGLAYIGKPLHCAIAQHDTEYYSTGGTR